MNTYGHRATDATSIECKASGAFAVTYAAGSSIDMQFHVDVVFWVVVTNLGTNTVVDIVAESSDDGSTIVYNAVNRVKSDDNITDGAFTAEDYTMQLTTAKGTLAVGACGPFRLPQVSGAVRLLVKGDNADGAYSLRYQRLS